MIKNTKYNTSKCDAVFHAPIFKNCLTEEQKSLISASNYCYHYKKDDLIFQEHFPITSIGVVLSGVVLLIKENNSSKQFISFVKEGELFGFRSNDEQNNIYYNSAMAFDDSHICLISIEKYNKLVDENHEFRLKIISYYTKRLENITKDFYRKCQMNAKEKVVDALLEIANIYEKDTISTPLILPIPRQLLANIAGVSLGKTIRIISELKKVNIISTNRSNIRIPNLNRLKERIK